MVKFCIKNKTTGRVRKECFATRSAARARCAELNRRSRGSRFTVVQR